MKKLIGLLSLAIVVCANMFGQSRVNAALPIVIDTGKELSNITGWIVDGAGQWESGNNFIPGYYLGSIDKIIKMKLYDVSFEEKHYILLDIVIPKTRYEYPSIRQGAYDVIQHSLYIFAKDDFQITLTPNTQITNRLKLHNYTAFDGAANASISKIQTTIPYSLKNPESIYSHGGSLPIERDSFIFYSFYYLEEKCVRFVFYHSYNKVDLEEQYFECSYDDYSQFFIQLQ